MSKTRRTAGVSALFKMLTRPEAAPGMIYASPAERLLLETIPTTAAELSRRDEKRRKEGLTGEAARKFAIKMAVHARKTGPLIDYLRNGGELTAEMGPLLADLLDGKIKAKPLPVEWRDWAKPSDYAALVRALEKQLQEAAGDEDKEAFFRLVMMMENRKKLPDFPETKREMKALAVTLARSMLKMTKAQWDEARYPRNRKKIEREN